MADIAPGDLVTTSAHYLLSLGYDDDYKVQDPGHDVYLVVRVELSKDREWSECTVFTGHQLFLCSSDFLHGVP